MKEWIKKRRWLAAAAGIVLLAITGLLVEGPAEETGKLLVHPKEGAFRVAVTATGELQAKNSVAIKGPSQARRARIYELQILSMVPEGTVVSKGDFVAELDRSELMSKIKDEQIELEQAQSQYEQTSLDTALTLSKARNEQINLRYAMEEAELKKEQSAYEAPSVKRQAEIDFDKARRAYEQAVENYGTQTQQAAAQMREVGAQLDKARRQYEDMASMAEAFTIKAPEKGMVIYRRTHNGQKIEEGSTVRVWNPVVATLPDLSVMESITYINEVDIQKIEEGQLVEVGLDADPEKGLSGRVTQVANIGEQRPGSDAKVFRVSIEINEADTTLRPAMTTSNTVVVDRLSKVLHVPLETVHASDSLTYVFARDGGRVVRQEVKLGLINENSAVVQKGLSADDQIYMSMPADTSDLALRELKEGEMLTEGR